MKREHIALVARARSDAAARVEVGRRYLAGLDGFPRHEQLALEYLTAPSHAPQGEAARVIGEHLELARLVETGHLGTLQRAADEGSPEAQFKWAVWLMLWQADGTAAHQASHQAALHCLRQAQAQHHLTAHRVLRSLASTPGRDPGQALLAALRTAWPLPFAAAAQAAVAQAAAQRDLPRLARGIRVALEGGPASSLSVEQLAPSIKLALQLALERGESLHGLPSQAVRSGLEVLVTTGDAEAAYWLGAAYAEVEVLAIPGLSLVSGGNLRKGSALLMRAADAGVGAAWMHLHRIHANHRSSVANPQLARFFLEKAAAAGLPDAQRRLGALVLRSGTTLKDSEQAIACLHAAASAGDASAAGLLRTLVLPVTGAETEAEAALSAVREADPWLATRLQLSRAFGLTKLEALCVDPLQGRRPWGLVVGPNPFVALPRLSAPRAVPAVDQAALDSLHRAALLIETAQRDGAPLEGDYRRRSARQRRLFTRLGIADGLFFANANARELDAMRKGPKWVLRARETLASALAADALLPMPARA